jgi:tetratricopeptide (TPR) repeat protein
VVERLKAAPGPWRRILWVVSVPCVLIFLFVTRSAWGQAAWANNLSNLHEARTLIPAAAAIYAVDSSKIDSAQIQSAIQVLGPRRAARWLGSITYEYWKAGDTSKAIELLDLFQSYHLEGALSSVERRQLAGIRCAVVLSGLPTAEAGVYQLNRALELAPDYPDALALKGIALGQLGQQSEGLALLRKSLELATEQEAPLIKLRLAQYYRTVGEVSEAEAVIRGVLNGYPGDSDAIALLSVLLIQQNRCLEAVPYAQAAVRANNRRGDLWRILGDVYWCTGQKVLARDAYQQAANFEPTYSDKLKDRLAP